MIWEPPEAPTTAIGFPNLSRTIEGTDDDSGLRLGVKGVPFAGMDVVVSIR